MNIGHADVATEADLSTDALMSLFRSANAVEIENLKSEALTYMESQYRNGDFTHELVTATAVFNKGQSASEVEKHISGNNLEIVRAEIKHPIGNQGRALTVSIGARNLLQLDGSITEQLSIAAGTQQFSMMQKLSNSEFSRENPEMTDFTTTPNLKFYKIEVYGKLGDVRALGLSDEIAALVVDRDDLKLSSFVGHKQQSAMSKASGSATITRKYEEGLPPGISADQIYNWGELNPGSQPQLPLFGDRK